MQRVGRVAVRQVARHVQNKTQNQSSSRWIGQELSAGVHGLNTPVLFKPKITTNAVISRAFPDKVKQLRAFQAISWLTSADGIRYSGSTRDRRDEVIGSNLSQSFWTKKRIAAFITNAAATTKDEISTSVTMMSCQDISRKMQMGKQIKWPTNLPAFWKRGLKIHLWSNCKSLDNCYHHLIGVFGFEIAFKNGFEDWGSKISLFYPWMVSQGIVTLKMPLCAKLSAWFHFMTYHL